MPCLQVSEPGTQTPPGSQSSVDKQQALLRCFVPYGRVVSFVWACIRRIVPAVRTSAVSMRQHEVPTIAGQEWMTAVPRSVVVVSRICSL